MTADPDSPPDDRIDPAIAIEPPASPIGLRPDESVQKILISATARFGGEFFAPDALITHAWPPFHAGRRDWFMGDGSPLSRTALMVSFRTSRPPDLPDFVIPNFEPAGDAVSSVLSVLFGKRFDVHGPFEMSGSFGVPDLTKFSIPNNRKLPHNSDDVRVDYPVPLDISQASRVEILFMGDSAQGRDASTFRAAALFYQRALQTVEEDPEVAYLHLITASEILSSAKRFDDDEHLDAETRQALLRIETEMVDGPRLARMLRSKLRGVKRRFVTTLASYVDPAFFTRSETRDKFGRFEQSGFQRSIEAAYDLRSRYVHTGVTFGSWIKPRHENAEVQTGKPVVPDKQMARILFRAPLFGGLERVVRCALLGFAKELGADLSGLEASPPAVVTAPAGT